MSMLAIWEAPFAAPLYLVTKLSNVDTALARFRKRAHIESFLARGAPDQKRGAIHLQKRQLHDPTRLARGDEQACLAYLRVIYLTVCALCDDWLQQPHRRHCCAFGLFRLATSA